jgi:predicted HTH transcriptional regulator
MDTRQLDALLSEDEGTALDFKRDQYPFEDATDEQKSEFLKDILAFANAWRRSNAYILIGV